MLSLAVLARRLSNSIDRLFKSTLAATVSIAIVLVVACGETKPVRVVSLKVDSAGSYDLEGRMLPLPELKHELRALRNSGATIQLHIHSAVDTEYQAVGKAVVAAQEAGIAQVSFVTEPPR